VAASLVWPERRLLLHVVAVLMVGLCIACAFLAREAALVAMLGVLYAVGWLTFYYRAVWPPRRPGDNRPNADLGAFPRFESSPAESTSMRP